MTSPQAAQLDASAAGTPAAALTSLGGIETSVRAIPGLYFTEVRWPQPPSSVIGVRVDTPWRELTPDQRYYATFGPPLWTEEEEFRHSGWRHRRQLIMAAMTRCCLPAGRQERFARCGAACWIDRSPSTDRVRVRANFCHDRWCQPCATARSLVIAENLRHSITDEPHRHIVLTLKHSVIPLVKQVDRLYSCFRRLRATALWGDHAAGGAAFLEVKLGRDGGWHPHLHVIARGTYIAQSALSAEWLAITGDSDNVWIELIRDGEKLRRYITKYASKPLEPGVVDQPEKLDELIRALHGRRLCSTFGDWRGIKLEAPLEGPDDWVPVCSLCQLIEARRAGEPWAEALWRLIRPYDGRTNNKDPTKDHPWPNQTPNETSPPSPQR